MKVVFICSGNICRSPMAAEYCRHRAAESGMSWLVVDSAGTLGIEAHPATAEAQEVMAELGVDLSRHRSKGVRAELLADADYTIGMERHHIKHLNQHYPEGTDRRMLLRAFESGSDPDPFPPELDDPIGGSVDEFREIVPIVARSVDHLLRFLRERRR